MVRFDKSPRIQLSNDATGVAESTSLKAGQCFVKQVVDIYNDYGGGSLSTAGLLETMFMC